MKSAGRATPFSCIFFYVWVVVLVLPVSSFAQDPSSTATVASPPADQTQPEAKRLFFIIPNYRTAPSIKDFAPIEPKEKFKIAAQDAFDRGTVILAGLFAGESQLTNSNRSFGQGAAGYGRYFGTAYADFVIGDFMTEGIFPSMLHQDPRYFRKGTGSKAGRLGYAVSQIFVTHNDSGRVAPNWSELLGNSTAVAISMSYYTDNRTASDGVSKLGVQLGVDMAANVIKEFWPEISRPFSHRKNADKH